MVGSADDFLGGPVFDGLQEQAAQARAVNTEAERKNAIFRDLNFSGKNVRSMATVASSYVTQDMVVKHKKLGGRIQGPLKQADWDRSKIPTLKVKRRANPAQRKGHGQNLGFFLFKSEMIRLWHAQKTKVTLPNRQPFTRKGHKKTKKKIIGY